ncbi:hypothetical protein [Halarcobacter sp.]|uniref:hypothetical protein n=1 Tax=Halarcobacter sp. TaxID=2321133 RepID=UPI002AAB26CB|nr:hypothetical protein [Halarcobacter sp.]
MSSKKKCWICGSIADSREHKIKKSDIIKTYGKSYRKNNECILVDSQKKEHKIQGPNSNLLKYEPLICKYCNNTKTQPFDFAYERFMEYFFKNKKDILYKRFIDFKDVYGEDFEVEQRNLFKYFAKSFGCRVATYGDKVPEDIVNLLSLEEFSTGLKISFSINEDKLLFNLNLIGNEDLFYTEYNNGIRGYSYGEYNDCLTIKIHYINEISGEFGSTWIANNRFIYLGSFNSSLPDEERKKLIKKLKNE